MIKSFAAMPSYSAAINMDSFEDLVSGKWAAGLPGVLELGRPDSCDIIQWNLTLAMRYMWDRKKVVDVIPRVELPNFEPTGYWAYRRSEAVFVSPSVLSDHKKLIEEFEKIARS